MLERLEHLSPTTRTVLRAALGVAVGIGLGLATLVLLFIGTVEFTGCFFNCSDPNLVGGSLLLAGAAVTTGLLFASLGWAAGMNNRSRLVRVFGVGFGLAAAFLVVVMIFG